MSPISLPEASCAQVLLGSALISRNSEEVAEILHEEENLEDLEGLDENHMKIIRTW